MARRNLRTIVLPRGYFARTPMIRWIVRIYDVVERFLRNPFWFFLWIFSISGWIRLRSWTWLTLAAIAARVMPLSCSRLSWGGGRCNILSIFYFFYPLSCIIREVCHQIFLGFHISGGNSSKPAAFLGFFPFFFFSGLRPVFPPQIVQVWCLVGYYKFLIGFSTTSEGFPSRFLKCSFYF